MDNVDADPTWTFLTSHARVLITIAKDPAIRVQDVAEACRITQRTVQHILTDLEACGYLTRAREGRRTRYQVTVGAGFRPPGSDDEIAVLLSLFATSDNATSE